MNLTNEQNLPEALVEAVRRDRYDKGEADFSVTELILPPRVAALKRKFRSQLVEDASDRIFALIGQGIHAVLERAAGDRYLVEQRFMIKRANTGTIVSGRIDLFDTETRTLSDWKVTSRYTTKDGIKPEWIAQGNLNKAIMETNGVKVERIEYVAIYRDWSKMAVARGVREMPLRQVEVFTLPIWTTEEAEIYLDERIKLHQQAHQELPECSDEERWYKPEKWAVKKKGRKRALKLCETEQEARYLIETMEEREKFAVEHRPGEHTRCMYYCEVAPYCTQFRQYMENEK